MRSDRPGKARETMLGHKMNCAQAVFTSFSEDLGVDLKTALRLAQGFGGGMHIGGTCGAVTGAYMALGLAQKFNPDNPREMVDKTYDLMREFNRRFNAVHGALNCTELTGYDLTRPEEAEKARAAGVFATRCPDFVADAVKIVEELLKVEKKDVR